jgi:hypothetical protein
VAHLEMVISAKVIKYRVEVNRVAGDRKG